MSVIISSFSSVLAERRALQRAEVIDACVFRRQMNESVEGALYTEEDVTIKNGPETQADIKAKVSEPDTMELEPGGTIVFSPAINSTISQDTGRIRRAIATVLAKILTTKNIIQLKGKALKAVRSVTGDVGYTLRKNKQGGYVDPKGSFYREPSYEVELIGISPEQLKKIARALADEFKQRQVLVKDPSKPKPFLLSGALNEATGITAPSLAVIKKEAEKCGGAYIDPDASSDQTDRDNHTFMFSDKSSGTKFIKWCTDKGLLAIGSLPKFKVRVQKVTTR